MRMIIESSRGFGVRLEQALGAKSYTRKSIVKALVSSGVVPLSQAANLIDQLTNRPVTYELHPPTGIAKSWTLRCIGKQYEFQRHNTAPGYISNNFEQPYRNV